tara:strand:- start:529 stop:921 length:393 start_codon:yes stop_codon:yes gene_type:complete
MTSSEDEAELDNHETRNTKEKSDATLEAWNDILDDPFCEYHGFDKISAIDIMVEYDKKPKPKGYYSVDEYDAFYAIACRLYHHSELKLHFWDLLHTIITLREYDYPAYPDMHLERFHCFDKKFIVSNFQT